jgi:hypothetical protein
MRIDSAKMPKSSFLSMEKDMNLIINKMFKNERLKRLLHYTSRDALNRPNITEDESLNLIKNNIKIVPKMYVDGSVLNYILINFKNFTPSGNPEFRDNIIEFDIICHFDQWQLEDFALRPYKIAAEIDSMFNNTHLTGIGELQFVGATQTVLTDEFAGVCLLYEATHGGEDKKFMPNPKDEERFMDDFKKLVND